MSDLQLRIEKYHLNEDLFSKSKYFKKDKKQLHNILFKILCN